jgi:hypothetical protein
VNHLKPQAECIHCVTVVQALQGLWHGFVSGTHHPRTEGLSKLGHTARVVRMVVGDQDGVEPQASLFQPLRDAIGLARIDHERALPVVQDPDVVVRKSR